MSKVSMKKLLISALGLLLVLFMAIGILVACNEDGTAVVSFDIGYEGGEAIESQTVKIGESVTLPSVEAARDGWSFVGWKQSGVDDDGLYVAGSSIKVLNDMTFVAQWQPTSLITVTFDANYQGAPAIDSKSVGKGEKIILPNAPDRSADGYIFDGWHIEGASQLFQAGAEYTVTVEVKFVASWSDNGIITAEYRGDYKYSDVEYLGQELGITEYYHITKDQIYYQGLPVTDLKKIDGGYSFVAHCYDNELGYASGTTDADDIHHGQDGYDYNVFELSFVAEMRYEFVEATGKKEICVYSKGADGTLEAGEPEVLEKVTFEAVFQGAGEGGTELRVPLVDYKVQAPQYTDTGFAGWYTAPNGYYLPGEKLDENKEYYQTIVFAPIYEYLGYYNNAETGDKLLLEKDNEGSWASILESGASYKQQLGSFAYDSVNKQVSVYSTESGKKIYVFQLDIENREYTDITPDFDLAEQFIGHWYGLYLEGKYYEIDITEGSYSVSSWEPGRQKVNGSQANYTTTAEGAIGVRVNYTNIYLSLNADGTLKAEYGKNNEATLVKVGTVIGNWHSDDASLVFKAEGVLEANGVSGTYQAASSGYTATVGEEHLTISVSEYGEMTVTSDLDSSELAGYYIPGTQAYVHPEPAKDALEGEFHGYYDNKYGYIFIFDGLGGLKVKYWYLEDDPISDPSKIKDYNNSYSTLTYTLEGSNASFNCVSANFTGVLSDNGKVLVVTASSKKYVLVKENAIEGTFSIDGVSYTFADGDVSFDGKNLKYELVAVSNKNPDKFAKWVAIDEGKMEYHFHFDEDAKLVLEKVDLTAEETHTKEDYYGTWTVDDDGLFTIVINPDGTGTFEYEDSDVMDGDDSIELMQINWTFDDNKQSISFTEEGEAEMFFDKGKCYLSRYGGSYTLPSPLTKQVVIPAKELYYGTWTLSDEDGEYEIVIKSDGTGSAEYVGDYSHYDDFSASITWTYSDTDGSIAFSAAGSEFKMLFEGDECYLTRGSYKDTTPMEKTEEEQQESGVVKEDYCGTWTGSFDSGDFTLVLKSDGTGSLQYEAGDMSDDDSYNGTFSAWSFDAASGKVTFKSAYCYGSTQDWEALISASNKNQLTLTGPISGSATLKLKEKEQAGGGGGTTVDYQALLKGTWGDIYDYEEETTYSFEFDGKGNLIVHSEFMWEDEPVNSTYTIDENGNISSGAYGGITGKLTADGKLTITFWGEEHALTKKK